MKRFLTIVMYHYVRQISKSAYPDIKGLEISLFEEQLGYYKAHHNIIKPEEFLNALRDPKQLPDRALLLTFDDGYLDHYSHVYPILMRNQLSAFFFPPAQCVLNREMLDVNKIHFILASVNNKQKIVDIIQKEIGQMGEKYNLSLPESYWHEYAIADNYDPAEVIFIKRILQKGLPLDARRRIIDVLFQRFVSVDEKDFAERLYVSVEQLKIMLESGMSVGSHGYAHN
ncbi:MAG: polysaccharide deacetylase, partial [Candidatus Moranbacteria bacterium]|nr:polysaccharide deacetylase [Candidatus Moranbacteria bacterium]